MEAPLRSSALPPLYSARAIRLFSVLFTVVFGGVLLYQNLRDVGNRGAARKVLLFSFIYTLVAIAIVYNLPQSTPLTLGINVGGGYVLAGYFIPKYLPDSPAHPAKKIWKPLLISVLIALPFAAAAVYAALHPEAAQ